MKHVVIGTAGHIDHGKTELVRALTGINTDRFREEQERGITIDIGFAPLPLGEALTIGFVDVPGHERFVKNMLAGIWGIDLVLLVIAADESVMPQTREHFDICSLLQVKRGLIALTKCDLVDDEIAQLAAMECREFVKGSFLASAPILPVSARTGAGLDALRAALAAAAVEVEPGLPSQLLRLPVDRSFSMKGFGTVVTGTLVSGRIAEGEEVSIYPEGRRCRVRGLQVHGRSVREASAGRRTAVNLQGLEAAQVRRGDVLAQPEEIEPTSVIDVRVRVLPTSSRPLEEMDRVRFHQGTSELFARVRVHGDGAIPPGGEGWAQLRLERPACCLRGDRFVLRRYSPMTTFAGGVVIDTMPPRARRRARSAGTDRLAALEAADRAGAMRVFASEYPDGVPLATLARRAGTTPAEAVALAGAMTASGDLIMTGEGPGAVMIGLAAVQAFEERVVERLEAYHAGNPLRPGMPREELRARAFGQAPPEVVRLVMGRLEDRGRAAAEKDVARLAGHRVVLTGEEAERRGRLEEAYRATGLNPPTPDEAAAAAGLDSRRAAKLIHLLLSEGRLVKIRDGKIFHASALEDLKKRLWTLRNERRVIDIGAFKELTGTSRKNAIPLLEHLDASRVTRRVGSDREILPPPGG